MSKELAPPLILNEKKEGVVLFENKEKRIRSGSSIKLFGSTVPEKDPANGASAN
jgi:hypothetical protein